MERKDFINAIFQFFRVKDEDKSLYRSYDLVLSKGRNIDWNKLYIKALEDAETKFLPLPGFFISRFKNCPKIDTKQEGHSGKKVRVFYLNGRFTDYTMCNEGQTIKQIKEKFKGAWEVREIRLYPKSIRLQNEDGEVKEVDVAFVGNKVIPENTPYEVLYART